MHVYIANREKTIRPHVPRNLLHRCVVKKCADCNESVLIDSKQFDRVIAAHKETKIICMECANKIKEPMVIIIPPLDEEVEREARKAKREEN